MDDADVVVVWMLQPIFFFVPEPDLWSLWFEAALKSDLFPVTGGV